MGAQRLDHVNIRTIRMEESIAFYGDALGLTIKALPAGDGIPGGAYAYDENDVAVVHLVGAEREAESTAPVRGAAQFGMIDHFALRCDECALHVERLGRLGYAFDQADVPQIGRHLVFVRDPNGVMVELSFPLDSTPH